MFSDYYLINFQESICKQQTRKYRPQLQLKTDAATQNYPERKSCDQNKHKKENAIHIHSAT